MAKRNKYRSIQKILSAYTKKKGISPGRDFNKVASAIYKANPKLPLTEIKKRIGKLYNKSKVRKRKVVEKKINFPPWFYYYSFGEYVKKDPNFEGIEINVVFPQMPEFNFRAIQLDAVAQFNTNGLKKYLRDHYNNSPTARFVLEDTDSKTTVTYMVDIGEEDAVPVTPDEPKPKESPVATSETPKIISDIDKQLELEKLKEKNLARIEMLTDKYKKEGYSKKQIMKLLGL